MDIAHALVPLSARISTRFVGDGWVACLLSVTSLLFLLLHWFEAWRLHGSNKRYVCECDVCRIVIMAVLAASYCHCVSCVYLSLCVCARVCTELSLNSVHQDDDVDAAVADKLLAPSPTPSNNSSSGEEPEEPSDAYKYQRRVQVPATTKSSGALSTVWNVRQTQVDQE